MPTCSSAHPLVFRSVSSRFFVRVALSSCRSLCARTPVCVCVCAYRCNLAVHEETRDDPMRRINGESVSMSVLAGIEPSAAHPILTEMFIPFIIRSFLFICSARIPYIVCGLINAILSYILLCSHRHWQRSQHRHHQHRQFNEICCTIASKIFDLQLAGVQVGRFDFRLFSRSQYRSSSQTQRQPTKN